MPSFLRRMCMKVYAVSVYPTNNLYKKNSLTPQKQIFENDSVSFSGYKSELAQSFISNIKTEKQAEKIFLNLFNKIKEDKNIFKTNAFYIIDETVQKKGFRGLLHQLWTANPDENIAKIIEKSAQEDTPLVLAKRNGQTVFELCNFGKNGFWNNLTDNSIASNDIKLLFSDGLNKTRTNFEFSMNKDADIILDQYENGFSVYTEFYKETGNRRKQIFSRLTYSETTYYKKDGRKNFWKNFFQGGAAVPIY